MLALMQSDRMVVRRVLGGNLSAFRVLVDRYGGVVHGVAYARLRNTADAEDVAQETFIRFYQQLDQLAHRRHVGSWLVQVARNVSVDMLRKRVREAERLKEAAATKTVVPDPVREELHRLLWDEIEKLEPDAQEVIVLHYFMKKKAREIASLLEINTNAAEKRLQRAREELGCRLTDVLGGELGELKADTRRADRIMAAVCAAPAIWKASAGAATAAGTAAGVATGAGAAKVSAGLAAVVLLAVLGYFLFDRYFYPYSTQDITAKSTVTMADSAPTAAPKTAAVEPSTEPAEASAPETHASRVVYPKVYGVMTGRVRYEDGSPAPGADVWIDNRAEVREYELAVGKGIGNRMDPVEPVKLSTTTDASGHYTISGIQLSNEIVYYVVYASKGGLFAQSTFDGRHLDREIVRDLTLHPDLEIGGVVRRIDGKPVSDARVEFDEFVVAKGRTEGPIPYELSGADGKFLFTHVPPASCRLKVTAEGYLSYLSPWLATGATDLVLQLDAANSISGRVINIETGQPVGDVLIQGRFCSADPKQPVYRSFEGKADSAGVFRVTGCEPGEYELSAGPDVPETTTLTLVEPLTVTVGTQPITGLELKMATGGVLRGKVIDDETGAPVPVGSRVAAWFEKTGSHGRGCETGNGGAYELAGLHDGEQMLRANDGPTSRVPRYVGKVTLKPGEIRDNYDIHLPVRPFAGVVVDEAGNPVPGASVYAVGVRHGWELAIAITDTKGQFRFGIDYEDAPASVYLQALTGDGYSPKTGPFQKDAQNTDIVLRIIRSGRLEGDVVDQNGRSLERVVICAMPESPDAVIPRGNLPINDGRSINIPIRDASFFVYPRLHPGKYTLEVRGSWIVDRPIATTDVTIEAGKITTAHLVVDMSEFGEIEGVVLAGGEPVVGQQVTVQHESYRGGARGTTGPDGFYSIRWVLPGQVSVTAEPQLGFSGQRMTQTAEVVSGEVTTVDFSLPGSQEATGSIEGYVMSGGSPARFGTVVFKLAAAAGSESYLASVDSQGWYRVEQLPEGAYTAEASYGLAIQTVPTQVTAGQATRLDIELAAAEVRGVVSGIRQGEKAFVMLFPGDSFLAEWSLTAMEALGERMLNMREIAEDGPFSFTQLNPGEYIIGAVAVPADAPFEAASMMRGRIAVSPVVMAAPDTPAEVDLAFE